MHGWKKHWSIPLVEFRINTGKNPCLESFKHLTCWAHLSEISHYVAKTEDVRSNVTPAGTGDADVTESTAQNKADRTPLGWLRVWHNPYWKKTPWQENLRLCHGPVQTQHYLGMIPN